MRRIPSLAALGALTATLTLTGCGGGSAPTPASATGATGTAAATPASATGSSSAAAASSAGPAASGGKIAVNGTLDDPVLGDHVVAQAVVRDFPFPASMSGASSGELVLVQLSATAGTKYYAGFQTTSLELVTADGTENTVSDGDDLDKAMAAAGYTPFPGSGALDTGKSGSGWVAFDDYQKDSPKLTLRLKRPALSTSDGQNIPAANFDVPLVK
ncbi:hypothetical protein ORV05_16105 [Amycolatopsis cynarae]|uniref:Secreted protein n=1 Tax=Amycolatopsis cynarae TaxID=2995223 RepID=A0ABY7BDK2_9PSEU|nr:hypothetical protein [Amycolatopsis sp. HUAS 11-8]WAL69223.1 hypothetical protein ORV05_16105 [Amycolatopsis sp. HUAS 11-8]